MDLGLKGKTVLITGGTIESLDESKWRHAWELKLFGYINLTRELFRRMKARKRGVIVNIIGMAAENPTFEYLCGGAANAGLAAFTKGMGKGSREHGVRVLGVHPPSTRTDRSEEHTSELQSPCNLVCRLLLEKKKNNTK